MTNPELAGNNEINVSEALRDRAWQFMPEAARTASQRVTVQYWARVAGNPRVTLIYGPLSNKLDIVSMEAIQPNPNAPRSPHTSYFVRSVTLDNSDGRVDAYWEGPETYGQSGDLEVFTLPSDPPTAEQDALDANGDPLSELSLDTEEVILEEIEKATIGKFTQEPLDYFLSLFDNI